MKIIKLFLFALILISAVTACTPKTASIPGLLSDDETLLTIEGANIDSMTMGEFRALEQKEFTLTRTNSKGKTTTGTYTGVQPSVLLKAIGAQDYSSIKLTASDGYEQIYTKDIMEAPDALFAILQDGAPISEDAEDGQIWFCAGEGFEANYWTKYVTKITVEP